MATYGNHTLPIFKDDIFTIKEYLKIAINIIFYHRWLNNNNVIEEKSINDISYLKIDNDTLEKEINNLLSQLDKYCQKDYDYNSDNQYPNQYNLQIILNFYTKKVTQLLFWSKPEGLWEKWNFLVTVTDTSSEKEDKEAKIRKFVSIIIKELNSGKDFMPDIYLNEFENINEKNSDSNNDSNFPFEITITQEFEQSNMISIFQNMNIKGSFNKII